MKSNKNNQFKLLKKAYSKNLTNLNKNFFNNPYIGLVSFVQYLRYLRDIHIIKDTESVEAATLTATIAEFEAYLNCNKDRSTFHWESFWELVKQNMEEWLEVNDTV